ncbi:lipopolysaccharide biosynthesis protein [Uliginosibacterium sp. H1]|uniref:lipopolysaccharide biosynthesis protein n=1 Tax=Uliginosibacterium sp. H1 TaxID=3114757 RepID=UPI002E17C891|nr:polysaccharide biosynthesis C-terminal domain-containing protein [Uliginosibacterium sp. H1]
MSLRASAIYMAARATAGLVSLVAVGLFARGLGPAGYGWVALASSVAAVAVAVFLQPLQHALSRFVVAEAAARVVLGRLLVGVSLALALCAAIAELVAGLSGAWPLGLASAAWVLGASQGLFDFSAQHATATGQSRRYAGMFVSKALLLVAIGAAALAVSAGVPGVVAAYGLAAVLAVVLVARSDWTGLFAQRPACGADVDTALWRGRLRSFCLPLGATLLMTAVLQWADRFMLAAAVPPEVLGAYAAVGDLTQQSLGFLFGALYLAWYPRLVRAHEAGDLVERHRLARRYALLALAVLLPAVAGFALVARALSSVFFGAAYESVALAVWPWLTLAIALACTRMFFADIGLYLAGRMGLQLRNVGLSAALGVTLNLWWAPVHSALGSAWAAVVAQAFCLALSMWSGRRTLGWGWPDKTWAAPVLSTLVMAVVVARLDGHGVAALAMQGLCGVAVYGSCMLVLDGAGCRGWLADWWRARSGMT